MPFPSSPVAPRRRAVLSVSDKTGLVEFAQRLARLGFELVSTGGTAAALRDAGLAVRDVAEVTEYPEMLEGRVKTLHPRIHGGLLGRWREAEHRHQMEAHGIAPIELLVVNLYPFEQVAERAAAAAGVERGELIENIDIGGPAMLRSGAKNFESVAVVTEVGDYGAVAEELEAAGAVSLETRWRLAQKAFRRTAAYDAAIAATLGELTAGAASERVRVGGDADLPARLQLDGVRLQSLRYGENPHQRGALYRNPAQAGGIAQGKLLQGKELSYNNLVDLEAAWDLVGEFDPPAVAIIKHTNPAGCALGATLLEAYQRALACDPVSAFGGVIGLNRGLDGEAAEAMAQLFVECIAAPGYSPEARARLGAKKNLRLLEVVRTAPSWTLRSLSGGWLLQDPDRTLWAEPAWQVVTRRAPTESEAAGLRLGWAVAKHVKSNAIVFARAEQTLAVGAGQMSRVDAVKVAGLRAQLPLQGSAMASDAFFPFPDGIEEGARLGATAVIQPGGSVRDRECIEACDRLGIAMVFTAQRHFRH
ncbi:MAG TPA: bifunctional phosphoribosylaminoimidazolecarboxamide formyltransferase/IMP cyclohydrolase [Terriglobales bacterium]|nr:bifunctional phosphoribosylaminoimidazolecarboxamide formyltransferase/IMP cyclohydrolase [Terriglobales bacterium]